MRQDARRDWPPSTPLSDSDDEFHIESCSPLAYRARSRFIQRNGRRRLRRTVDVMIEESWIRMLELKVEPRLREQFQPIHLAAHLGDLALKCGGWCDRLSSSRVTSHRTDVVRPK